MFSRIVPMALLLFIITATAGLAAENKGAAMMNLTGGKQGDVAFPHQKHQNKLGDCQVCHAVFPQTKGGIDQMKQAGKLKSRAVMNQQCIKCHRAEKKAGNPSGPLTCRTCHKK